MFNLEKFEDVRKLLVDHDVNGVNNQGDTPLIVAVKKGNEEIVELLIANGAYVNFRDDDAATSLHRAVEQGLNTT